jgi:hypothetical protein
MISNSAVPIELQPAARLFWLPDNKRVSNRYRDAMNRQLRVKNCPSDHVGSTSGVPEIATGLAAARKSAEVGQIRTS